MNKKDMQKRFHLLLAFFLTSIVSHAQVTVTSLVELRDAIQNSNQEITMTPGDYNFEDLDADKNNRDLIFSGSNNTITLTGVYVEVPVGSVDDVYIEVSGDNNTIIGGEFEDVYRNGLTEITDFSAYNQDRENLAHGLGGDPVMKITGEKNVVDGIKLTVRGSFPYGYGSMYGINQVNVFGLDKRCGLLINGPNNTLNNVEVQQRAFGHAIFMQGDADSTVINNTYVEGRTRPTAELYYETNSYDLPFLSGYKYPYEDNRPIIVGEVHSLCEDGIRQYNGVGSVFVTNCTVKKTRGGMRLYLGGQATVKNSTAIDCGNTNWNALGQVETNITADYPLANVFNKEVERTYIVQNYDSNPITVNFSDGFSMLVPGDTLITNRDDEGDKTRDILMNLAIGKTVTASSEINPNIVEFINDEDASTRWESEHNVDPQWVTVDLGQKFSLTSILIDWEGANASSYVLEGSNDGVSWEELKSLENQAEGNHRIDNYQYVRIYGTSRNLTYGYSIYEIEIYGDTIGVISSVEENHDLHRLENNYLQDFTLEFYTKFAERYDNDPRLAFVQLGFGSYSEYHLYDGPVTLGQTFPSKSFQTTFLNHVNSEFVNTQWSLSIDAASSSYTPIAASNSLKNLNFGLFDDSFLHEEHSKNDNEYNRASWLKFGADRANTNAAGGELNYYSNYDQENVLNKVNGPWGTTYEELSAKYDITYMIGNDQLNYQTPARIEEAGMSNGYRFEVTSYFTQGSTTTVTIKNNGIAPIYYDAYPSVGGVRSTESLKGLIAGASKTFTIQTIALGEDLVIACDRLVQGQEIQFDANLEASITGIFSTSSSLEAVFYPNPCANNLHLIDSEISHVNIWNLQGKMIYEATINGETSLDIEQLPKGIYTLNVQTPEGTTQHKLLKK